MTTKQQKLLPGEKPHKHRYEEWRPCGHIDGMARGCKVRGCALWEHKAPSKRRSSGKDAEKK